ncbi:hypothetical protein FDZ73_23765 [bacterium]|nr:MAG: hypothetical protein FDZ73_23765 [bacterium]
MNPSEYYRSIVASIEERDLKKVAEFMLAHVGETHAVDLTTIAVAVFEEFNPSTERKVRLILEDLTTKYHMPIGAYSGKAGRWLCQDQEEIQRVVADLERRVSSTNDRIRALRMANLSAQMPQVDRPRQQSLWR